MPLIREERYLAWHEHDRVNSVRRYVYEYVHENVHGDAHVHVNVLRRWNNKHDW
ncbi:protein of unknown function [Xenorhabdus doucetiae]|uniref:Uncharacterized protein n=1 Tax=Xenorhabdus doucetiae TaxID=351671 RepID=A0A068QWA8_9GAMM|nr:protein of unknown function [Xenorhabdus doucetiae]